MMNQCLEDTRYTQKKVKTLHEMSVRRQKVTLLIMPLFRNYLYMRRMLIESRHNAGASSNLKETGEFNFILEMIKSVFIK
jgi:hypothetical protein